MNSTFLPIPCYLAARRHTSPREIQILLLSRPITRHSITVRLQRKRLGLLSGVAGERFLSSIDAQLARAAGAELVLRKHTEHCFANYFFGAALQKSANRDFLQ